MSNAVKIAKTNRRRGAYLASGALLLLAAFVPLGQRLAAQSGSYDPYADAVQGTTAVVSNANNAVGAPNGTTASLAGLGAALTLDMGSGEEGTQTLRLHHGAINLQANVTVTFLDAQQAVIASETRQLGADFDAGTQNFAYNWTDYAKAYRFVRISSNLGAGVSVDAVEALGYIGSTPTQDTDDDGIPDRTDSNPLVPNPSTGNAGGAAPVNPPRTTKPGGTSTGASQQVNNPPETNNDKDGDGMADDWESAHGLDPTKNDAGEDPDHDDLTNLTEYRIDSDPQKFDTDGDGMPDGWEYDNGLDVNKNDADGDPDGDFLTNLGEYRNGTDPNKADDLSEVFGKDCGPLGISMLAWWLLAAALVGGFVAGRTVARRGPAKGGKRSNPRKK
jgi:hypothetical protein